MERAFLVLFSLVLELDSSGGTFTGQDAHGWFLRTFLGSRRPDLASQLHEPDKHKPFTIAAGHLTSLEPSRITGAAPFVLRIGSTAPVLSRWLADLDQDDFGCLRMGSGDFSVRRVHRVCESHSLAGESSVRDLWNRTARGQLSGRVRLRFISPTAFDRDLGSPEGKRDRRNTLFPIASLVFASLVRRWNAAVALSGPAEGALAISAAVAEELLRLVREEDYRLETEPPVTFNRFREKGFTGECQYSVGRNPPRAVQTGLHVLARFAFFSGVGVRATMGMGQTICTSG